MTFFIQNFSDEASVFVGDGTVESPIVHLIVSNSRSDVVGVFLRPNVARDLADALRECADFLSPETGEDQEPALGPDPAQATEGATA